MVIGNGNKVIKQFPEKSTKVTNKDKIFIITNDNDLKVPDVVGYSSKEASALLKLLGIKIKTEGKGYVTSQSIAKDTAITEGMEITLTLSPKFTEG